MGFFGFGFGLYCINTAMLLSFDGDIMFMEWLLDFIGGITFVYHSIAVQVTKVPLLLWWPRFGKIQYCFS